MFSEGDSALLNIYHVIEVNSAMWPKVNVPGSESICRFYGFQKNSEYH